MRIVIALWLFLGILFSVSTLAADNAQVIRYPFDNRFSQNAKLSADSVKYLFGDISDSEIIDILSEISVIPSPKIDAENLLVAKRFRRLGFRTLPALERLASNADASIRRNAIWMACRLIKPWELQKSEYRVADTALGWLFCRSILDVDENVRKEARIGLSRIIGANVPIKPIPQGALEGIWLYEITTPDSVEYRKVMKDIRKLKIPVPPEWFIKTIDSYEVKKAKKEMSLHKEAEKSGCIQDNGTKD